jgi:hypothetical protein
MNVSVGQEVLISTSYGKPRTAKVAKVARKYFYVAGEREGFDKETGQGQNGWLRAVTVEAHDLDIAATAARKELRDFGVELNWRMTADQVLAVRAALAPVLQSSTSHGEGNG